MSCTVTADCCNDSTAWQSERSQNAICIIAHISHWGGGLLKSQQVQGIYRLIATACRVCQFQWSDVNGLRRAFQQGQSIRCALKLHTLQQKGLHMTDLARHYDWAVLLRTLATGQAGTVVLDMRSHRPDLPQIHHP